MVLQLIQKETCLIPQKVFFFHLRGPTPATSPTNGWTCPHETLLACCEFVSVHTSCNLWLVMPPSSSPKASMALWWSMTFLSRNRWGCWFVGGQWVVKSLVPLQDLNFKFLVAHVGEWSNIFTTSSLFGSNLSARSCPNTATRNSHRIS